MAQPRRVGARPLALTDNLNFGNPEKPEAMGQFVGCSAGHRRGGARARFPHRFRQCLALQRDDGRRASCRRRRSAASAWCRTSTRTRRAAFKRDGRRDFADRRRAGLARALGLARRSARDARRARRRRSTSPPSGATASSCSAASRRASSTAVHDVSDGGLAVALAEMAIAGGVGAAIDAGAVRARPMPSSSARIRAAMSSPRGARRRQRCVARGVARRSSRV